jgi:hypothetical protein
MKKSELNARQLGERSAVIRALVAAGWTETSQGDWFERDLWAQHEATLEYDNGSMNLRIALSAEHRTLELWIEDYAGGQIALSMFFEDRLTDVLDSIVRVQDGFTPDSYQQAVQELVRHCPEVHVLAGADATTWVRLVDNQHELSTHQQSSRERFISRLSQAGWRVESDLREPAPGDERTAEAVADFQNAALALRLSYFPDGWLRLLFDGPEASQLLPLRLKWKSEPDALLDALIETQHTFSAASYAVCIAKLIAVADLVLLETDKGLVRLSV